VTPSQDPNASTSGEWSLPEDAPPETGPVAPPPAQSNPGPPWPGYYPYQSGPYNPYAPTGGVPGYGLPGRLVTWGPRVGAVLLDAFMILPFEIAAIIIAVATSSDGTYDPDTGITTGGGPWAAGTAVALLLYLGAFAFGLYQLYRLGTTGQTIGMKVVGIRLVREADGRLIGFGMAFVRSLAHVLDALPCYLGFLWPLWDAKRQTFADKVCGTVVVMA
jgi:uncharacterized RDD family membrane protein YckC